MNTPFVVVWFRQDLRLVDNPAWQQATRVQLPILPLYILEQPTVHLITPGAASRWWLHHGLQNLQEQLQGLQLNLVLRTGKPREIIQEFVQSGALQAVFWNRRYDEPSIALDRNIKEDLKQVGIHCESCNGHLMLEPWENQSQKNNPFQVFTPYFKQWLQRIHVQDKPFAAAPINRYAVEVTSLGLEDLQLLPKLNWDLHFYKTWFPINEQRQWQNFSQQALYQYEQRRDFPAEESVSRMSPYLAWGQLGIQQLLRRITSATDHLHEHRTENQGVSLASVQAYLRQLAWRDFAYHLLYHFPHTIQTPLRPAFEKFPWQENQALFEAWSQGQTGYPLVDAGMRQLWQSGWMHNRVRMVVASFLCKHLRIPWQWGAKWFWNTLVDYDVANNTFGWQWTAGCGADAAPYFRIFNPVTQSEKFDPQGHYLHTWLPELQNLAAPWIHRPWEAPTEVLHKAGVALGRSYPKPIVDHDQARKSALAAYATIKQTKV